MTGAAGEMMMVKCLVSEFNKSPEPVYAVMENSNKPDVVGVPEISPVELFNESPGGSPISAISQSEGLFVACNCAL